MLATLKGTCATLPVTHAKFQFRVTRATFYATSYICNISGSKVHVQPFRSQFTRATFQVTLATFQVTRAMLQVECAKFQETCTTSHFGYLVI